MVAIFNAFHDLFINQIIIIELQEMMTKHMQ